MKQTHFLHWAMVGLSAMLILVNEAAASELAEPPRLSEVAFATGGFGGGTTWSSGGPAYYGAYTFSLRGDRIMTVRSVYVTEMRLAGLGHPTPLESSWDLGLLYGVRTHNHGIFLGTASIGLSLVTQTRRGNYLGQEPGWFFVDTYYEEKHSTTLGIPLELQAILSPTSGFGLGLTVFGDVNPASSFWGTTLSIFLGQLR